MIRITRVDSEALGSRPESWGFTPQDDEFEYLRRIGPGDQGGAIRMTVQSPEVGFLGAFSRPVSDLGVLGFFLGHLGLAYFAWRYRERERELAAAGSGHWEEPENSAPPRIEIREVIKEVEVIREVQAPTPPSKPQAAWGVSPDAMEVWSLEATSNLRELGHSMRDVLRGARDITLAAAATRESLDSSAGRLQETLKLVSVDGREAKALGNAAIKAEALALNVVLSALRLSEKASAVDERVLEARERLRRDAEVLVAAIQTMRTKAEGREESARRIEEFLRPCSGYIDLAVRAQDPVFELSRAMEEPTRAAGERLIQQARLLKKTPAPESIPAHEVESADEVESKSEHVA